MRLSYISSSISIIGCLFQYYLSAIYLLIDVYLWDQLETHLSSKWYLYRGEAVLNSFADGIYGYICKYVIFWHFIVNYISNNFCEIPFT